jgi:hypothetical protein
MAQINKALDETAERFHDVGGKVLFPDVAWPGLVVTEANESAAYLDLVASTMVSTENDEPRKFVRLWNDALPPAGKKSSKRIREVRYLFNIPENFSCSGATGAVTTLRRIGKPGFGGSVPQELQWSECRRRKCRIQGNRHPEPRPEGGQSMCWRPP